MRGGPPRLRRRRVHLGGRHGPGENAARNHAVVDTSAARRRGRAHGAARADRLPHLAGQQLGRRVQQVAEGAREDHARVRELACGRGVVRDPLPRPAEPGAGDDHLVRDVPHPRRALRGEGRGGRAAGDVRRGAPPEERRHAHEQSAVLGAVQTQGDAQRDADAEPPRRILRNGGLLQSGAARDALRVRQTLRTPDPRRARTGCDGETVGAGARAQRRALGAGEQVRAEENEHHPVQAPAPEGRGSGLLQARASTDDALRALPGVESRKSGADRQAHHGALRDHRPEEAVQPPEAHL